MTPFAGVLTDAEHLLRAAGHVIGADQIIVVGVAGDSVVEYLTIDDWKRTVELVTRCTSLPLGGTDASLLALAERHEQTEIATLDHQHFTVVRPNHVDAFTLLP